MKDTQNKSLTPYLLLGLGMLMFMLTFAVTNAAAPASQPARPLTNSGRLLQDISAPQGLTFTATSTPCIPPFGAGCPSPTPTITATPTTIPTDTPTNIPTSTSTTIPTDTPTNIPTSTSTTIPTDTPTNIPTGTSTTIPTDTPTNIPTTMPTTMPTDTPIARPTRGTRLPGDDTATPTPTLTATPVPATATILALTPSPTTSATTQPTVTPTQASSTTQQEQPPTITPSASPIATAGVPIIVGTIVPETPALSSSGLRDPLEVTKESNVADAQIGDKVNFTIKVKNRSRTANLTGVVVTDTMPLQLTINKVITSRPAEVTITANIVVINIGTLAPGEIITIRIESTLAAEIPGGIQNTILVNANDLSGLQVHISTKPKLPNTGSGDAWLLLPLLFAAALFITLGLTMRRHHFHIKQP